MADKKKKGAKNAKPASSKAVPEAKLRDLDLLDEKIKHVKGGAKRTGRLKRTRD